MEKKTNARGITSGVEDIKNFLKEKSCTFGNWIFFGDEISYLVYAIFINNKEFIDFDDARPEFHYLFCIRSGNVWIMKKSEICFLDSFHIVDFHGYNWEKIDELKLFIRQNSHKNTCKDKRYCGNIPRNNIDLNKLREMGYFEIDVKENFEIDVKESKDRTGFKYKLVDYNNNLISYAVDQNQSDITKLTDYLSNMYTDSELKNFIEKFNLALNSKDFVLKNTVKGIYLTDEDTYDCRCVFLGIGTNLVFTEEFSDTLEKAEKSNNEFCVLPQSRTLKDIGNFILQKKCLPFARLSFINKDIAKSYNFKKRIGYNLAGKDMTTLCIYDLKIDPNLQSNKFSDDLAELIKIDDSFKCAITFVKLLLKITVPNSNFKYELNSFKDGESILKTDDISKALEQIQNNIEKKTLWPEEKGNQSLKTRSPREENFNSNDELSTEKHFTFGNHIFFGQNISYLVYAIFIKNEKFIDFDDARKEFQYIFCIESGNAWIIEDCGISSLDNLYDVYFNNYDEKKIDALRLLIRPNNYKNVCKNGKYRDNIHNISYDDDIGLDELREMGYFEIDVKENKDKTGFKYKLVDCNNNLISYAVDENQSDITKLTGYLSSICNDDKYKQFIERFNLGLDYYDFVLTDRVSGIYLMGENANGCDCVFLGIKTKLVFTKEFLNMLKWNWDGEFKNQFYVLPQSQAFKDILDFIVTTGLVPFEYLSFINEDIVKSYDFRNSIDDNLDRKNITTLRIYDLEIDSNLQSNKFNDDLAELWEISDGCKCTVALIELLSKIKDPDSNFKYEFLRYEHGKLILKTNDISNVLEQIQNNTEKKTLWLEQALESQKTNHELGIQIEVADLKEFLINNGIEQKDFKNIYMKDFFGKPLARDKNGKKIKEINIGNLENLSYINIELSGKTCILGFLQNNTLNKTLIKSLTLKLELINDSFYLQYFTGEKRGKIGIKVKKLCISDHVQKSSTEPQKSNITQRPSLENIDINDEPAK